MQVVHVVGARPNFMKAAPVILAMAKDPASFTQVVVHTGQHYDQSMSDAFFKDLGLALPDVNLGVGSGSHGEQIANVMLKLEPELRSRVPDWHPTAT